MKFDHILAEAKKIAQKQAKKQEPWQVPLAVYLDGGGKKVVYKGLAAPDLSVPAGVISPMGEHVVGFYGKETVVAKERIYQRDMGNASFELWAWKLQGAKEGRFRIILVSYMVKDGQKIKEDPFPGPGGPAWTVRAGFAFEDHGRPLAGYLDHDSISPWNPKDFFNFVRKHGGWSPPKGKEDMGMTQNIVLMRQHRAAVAEALRDGKPVSKEVLKDYPRLSKHKPGTPGFYVAQFLLVPVEFAKAGDTVARVVYGPVGGHITPRPIKAHGMPHDPMIHGLHVTKDAEVWKKQLRQDMGRPEKNAKVIHIRVMPEDVFLSSGEAGLSSAILVTARKDLKQGDDFYLEGRLAGQK